jgi:hypothetical protein
MRIGDGQIRKQIEDTVPRFLGEGWLVTAIYRYEVVNQMPVWVAIAQCGDHIELMLFMTDGHGGVRLREATYQIGKAVVIEEETDRGQLI